MLVVIGGLIAFPINNWIKRTGDLEIEEKVSGIAKNGVHNEYFHSIRKSWIIQKKYIRGLHENCIHNGDTARGEIAIQYAPEETWMEELSMGQGEENH